MKTVRSGVLAEFKVANYSNVLCAAGWCAFLLLLLKSAMLVSDARFTDESTGAANRDYCRVPKEMGSNGKNKARGQTAFEKTSKA